MPVLNIFFLSTHTKAQIFGRYEVDDTINYCNQANFVTLEIDSPNYFVLLSFPPPPHGSDATTVDFVSLGTFEKKGNILLLSDRACDPFKMSYIIVGNNLVPQKTIWGLNSLVFHKISEHSDYNARFFKEAYDNINKSNKNDTICNNQKMNQNIIFDGEYTSPDNQDIYSLTLASDSTYRFLDLDLLVSYGKWWRYENKLYLYDSRFNTIFHGCILKENKIKLNSILIFDIYFSL